MTNAVATNPTRPTISEALSGLKMHEWRNIEKLTGKAFSDEAMLASSTFTTALFYIYKVREDKGFTWADANDATFAELNEFWTPEPQAAEDNSDEVEVEAPKSEAA